MIGYCKDCRFWAAKQPGDQGASIGAGQCKAVPKYFDVVECDQSKDPDIGGYEADVLRTEFKNLKAVALDGTGYLAELLTMPDFGCTNYEPKG